MFRVNKVQLFVTTDLIPSSRFVQLLKKYYYLEQSNRII